MVLAVIRRRRASTARAWTPLSLPSLALWLDASDAATITLAGSKISQWNDKSGNGRNVTQGTDAARPTLTSAGLNSKDVATFGGSQHMAGSGFTHGGTWSAGVVASQSADGQALFQIGTINEAGAIYRAASQWRVRPSSATGIASASLNAGADLLSATVSATDANLYVRGTLGTPLTQASASASNRPFTVGALDASTYRLNGIIAELVVTAAVLSEANRQKLEGYLAHKWGMAANLPSNHPYKNAAPTA